MPVIKSAIKKVRVDARRRAHNLAIESELKTVIRRATQTKTFAAVSEAYSALDRAVKRNLVHRNFANRKKAQLSKLVKPSKAKVEAPKTKKVAKKATPKKKSPAKAKRS